PQVVSAAKLPILNPNEFNLWNMRIEQYFLITDYSLWEGNPQHALKDKGVIDSRCLRHMTGNMSYLSNFEEINGGYIAFGGNSKGGKITGKGKIRIDTECIVLSPEFKLPDENQV
nr:hypothetical protein [Tanacetum cinerariifolium]